MSELLRGRPLTFHLAIPVHQHSSCCMWLRYKAKSLAGATRRFSGPENVTKAPISPFSPLFSASRLHPHVPHGSPLSTPAMKQNVRIGS